MGEPDIAAPPMRVGFNYPSSGNADGFQFGPFPHVDPKGLPDNPLWSKSLPKNLVTLSKMGVSVVRWFILGNCFNYGPAPFFFGFAPPFGIPTITPTGSWVFNQPNFLDDPKYTGDPNGQFRRFDDHFVQMLKAFQDFQKQAPMKVIPSIIDFHALLDPFPGERDPSAKLRARGRGDIVEDPKKRDLFLKNVVKRFVDLAVPFKDAVFAMEVINEPIWNSSTFKPAPPVLGNRIIPPSAMSDFLARACDIIEDASLESTVGHRFFEDCLKFPTGTMAQFHYYPHQLTVPPFPFLFPTLVSFNLNADPGTIPDHAQALSQISAAQVQLRPKSKKVKDVFVGEFGCRLVGEFKDAKGNDDNHGQEWPELNGIDILSSEIVFRRLALLASKKYNLAVVWPDNVLEFADEIINTADPAKPRKMTLKKIQSLIRFTGGAFP